MMFDGGSAYTHNGDRELCEELGLKTTGWGREWTEIGTVIVAEEEYEKDYGHKHAATVKVEVSCLPAQFFRFTINVPVFKSEHLDETERSGWYGTKETILSTGSGGIGEYWPVAKLFAEDMISVAKPGEEE